MGLSSKVQMDGMLLRMAVISTLCVAYSMAAAPAPAPQVECGSQITSLIPCLNYVQGTVTVPPNECCTSLSSVVKNAPSCLCQLLTNPSATSAGVNKTDALGLPAKCGILNADISQCSGPTSSPEAGGTTPGMGGSSTPGMGGSSTPTTGSPSSSTFISTPTNMVYLVFVAACLLFLVN